MNEMIIVYKKSIHTKILIYVSSLHSRVDKGKYTYFPINRINGTMVDRLDGNSEHVAHAWGKIYLYGKKYSICDCSRSNQMP